MTTLLLSSKEFANATETTLQIGELSAFVIRGVAPGAAEIVSPYAENHGRGHLIQRERPSARSS